MSAKSAPKNVPDKKNGNGSQSKRSGRLSVAVATLAAAVLVLPLAPAIFESLGLQLSIAGQRITGILAAIVAVIALPIALQELVQKYGHSWRPRTRKLFIFSALATGAVLVFFLALFNDPYVTLPRMPGTQDVAILGFVRPDGSRTQPLEDLAVELADQLAGQLATGTASSYAAVRPPLHKLQEAENSEMSEWTTEFIERSGADLVLAGIVDDQSGPQIRVQPAIYVSPALVPEAMELSGWTVGTWLSASGTLESRRGRESVLTAFLQDGLSIAHFVDALDAWRVGDLAEADRLLENIPAESQGLLSVDMLYLFRGHARQLVALNTDVVGREDLLVGAAAYYRSIPVSSTIAVRAELSLAINEYHRSSGRLCSPGEINKEGLEHASTELQRVVGLAQIRPPVRLAAMVNLAQVLACMRRAGLPVDDAKLASVLTDIRAFETPDVVLRPLVLRTQALGRAIEAEQARKAGRHAQALDLIHQSIAMSANPRDLGLWWGWVSIWEAQRCDDVAARNALREAVAQYQLAVDVGRMTQQSVDRFVHIAVTDLDELQERCVHPNETHPSQSQ
jgi:hypothetical protein